MARYSRLTLTVSLICAGLGTGASAQIGVRKEVSELTRTEVASLRRGFEVMISRNTAPRGSNDFRRSLLFWANAHAHFGDDCEGEIDPRGAGYAGVSEQSASGQDERDAWCKCEHGNEHFLTWHRLYLAHFEEVLREASGNPQLRLPYWNYERNRQIPAIFREQTYIAADGRRRANPLFVSARQRDLAAGRPLDPGFTSSTLAFQQAGYEGFGAILEGQPHGAIHCAIGVRSCPSGRMGDVPSAGLDPIFYMHHNNLDRLYECWLGPAPGARLPSEPAIVNRRYSFATATGEMKRRQVSEMLRADQIGYSYSNPSQCPSSTGGRGGNFLSSDDTETYTLAPGATLSRGVTRVPIRPSEETRDALESSQFLSADVQQRMLVIENIRFDVPPQTSYKVFLVTGSGERALAGIVQFFGATHHRGPGERGVDARLDVTNALPAVSPSGDLPEDLALEFVPSTGAAGSSADQAAQDIPANANVRYGRVRLVVVSED